MDQIKKETNIHKKISEKVGFIWNMIGSLVFSASTMLLSLVVIRVIGAEQGGSFAIAITIGQMVLCIAYFEMRTFQVTDVKNEFNFGEYHSSKIIICMIALLFSVIYVVTKQYDIEKCMIVLLLCFTRFFDGYADVYEAQFQKDERLDLSGKSLAYRTAMFVITLCGILVITKKLLLSLVIADVVALIGLLLLDVKRMHKFRSLSISFSFDKIKKIISSCLPLFIGSYCWTYILSASRIAIDANMSSEFQSYYQIIFMPVSVISLFASFLFRPLLPKLSEIYNNKEYREFYRTILKGVLWMVIITIICMAGAFLVGIPVLSIVSGCDLEDYRLILVFLILAGGFNGISFVMYYVLTIMRCSKSILIDYVLSATLAFAISSPMVKQMGINGAAGSYFICVILLCVLFVISIALRIKKDKKKL